MNAPFLRSARVISIASGKGGVGKTSIAVNLALSLQRMGKRTMLVDYDIGMANAGLLMGVQPTATLADVIKGRLSVDEALSEGPAGLKLLAGSNEMSGDIATDVLTNMHLQDGLRPFARMSDYILVDTPSGASSSTVQAASRADMAILVVSPEPTAFMDAYATLKMMTLDQGCNSVAIITNMVDSDAAGRLLFAHFQDVSAKFLPVRLRHLGSVPSDPHMSKAVLHKRCCVDAYHNAPATMAFTRLALALTDPPPPCGKGGSEFFGTGAYHGLQ